MPRKTLKQKLKSQNRVLTQIVTLQHDIGVNAVTSQAQQMQSVCMAHGIMATLSLTSTVLTEHGVDVKVDPAYLAIEKDSNIRIAQCVMALRKFGLSHEEINMRIQRGH